MKQLYHLHAYRLHQPESGRGKYVRGYISDNFGKKYLPESPNQTPAKKTHRKRTKRFVLLTSIDGGIVEGYGSRCAETVPVNRRQFVACQMTPAKYDSTTLTLVRAISA